MTESNLSTASKTAANTNLPRDNQNSYLVYFHSFATQYLHIRVVIGGKKIHGCKYDIQMLAPP